MAETTHNVFKVIKCPECVHVFDWIGTRLPTHCPECGRAILTRLRTQNDQHILVDAPCVIHIHRDRK
jgi:DNA-directed RNA polymerase subunit RPC12/RpoP